MPVGDFTLLSAQAYRTSPGAGGQWLVLAGGVARVSLTAWLLIGTWRHTGKRLRTQEALVAETNFRRAMENSLLTGCGRWTCKGRITYVNAAFCQMTSWSEAEAGRAKCPPTPYWPQAETTSPARSSSRKSCAGKTVPGGFQVRVQR